MFNDLIKILAAQGDDFTIWVALFGLGLVAVFALFLSSQKIETFKKKQDEEDILLKKAHQAQDAFVSKIGEDIHNIAKENLNKSNIAKSESQILAITTNLIDFLRIKSKKVVVSHQHLKLSNLLNDVSGTLKTNTRGKEFELIYDVQADVEKELISDTLNISKILVNILLYCVENNSQNIHLSIAPTSLSSKNDQLSFTIKSELTLHLEDEVDIFRSNYNENTEEYDYLGLFIAKELSKLMKGDLIARNDAQEQLEFVCTIPYVVEDSTQTTSSQPNVKKVKPKNILLIDSSEKSAKNIETILSTLGHDVKRISKEKYIDYIPYFDIYDVIFLDEKLFTHKIVSVLENANIKIIATSNLFGEDEYPNANIADAKISKPLTIWQVKNVLDQLFLEIHNTSKITHNGVVNAGNALVHRNSFQNTRNITLHDFATFKNKKILLVEDNIINQKVFLGILGKSNMKITVANHGKEALKILQNDKNFDMIFMDINMPVMDGYTASIKIRENQNYNDIVIIALSALTSSDEIAKMFTSGMNGYMAKPLQKEKLYTVFSIYLDNVAAMQTREEKQDPTVESKYDGLNIALGISKSSASTIFYKEILTEFQDAYGHTDTMFTKLIKDFRYEQLRILCVDMKGLTGTIGAEKLHSIVSDILTKLSRKQHDFIPELVKQYTTELALVNRSISQYIH